MVRWSGLVKMLRCLYWNVLCHCNLNTENPISLISLYFKLCSFQFWAFSLPSRLICEPHIPSSESSRVELSCALSVRWFLKKIIYIREKERWCAATNNDGHRIRNDSIELRTKRREKKINIKRDETSKTSTRKINRLKKKSDFEY